MKKIILGVVTIIMAGVVAISPVFADRKCTLTSVLGNSKCSLDGNNNVVEGGDLNCSCDDGNGSSVFHILNLVIDIMTVGVGILGVVGISIVGFQYLTAGDSEEKTRKAKRRLLEIVIGLVAYVVIYSLLNWLIPDFQPFGLGQ